MNIEALKQQLAEGKITQEQFAAELKKLLEAGTITQEEHDAAAKVDPGTGGGTLNAEQVQAMIAEAVKKAEQSAGDKVRTEYAAKLKAEQDKLDELRKAKMSDEEKAKFEKEKFEKELKEREDALNMREVALHTIDKLTEAKLPLSFKDFLVSGTKEDAEKNIIAFQTAWQAAIKAEVETKFKQGGGKPPGGQGATSKKWAEMTLTEQGKLLKENPEQAKALALAAGVILDI
jgi:hypothetical protein